MSQRLLVMPNFLIRLLKFSINNSRSIRHPGRTEQAPDQTFAITSPTKCFSEGLNHYPTTTRIILEATVPETSHTDDYRPDNVHSVDTFSFTASNAVPSPRITIFVAFTTEENRQSATDCQVSKPRPHHSRKRFYTIETVLSFVFSLA